MKLTPANVTRVLKRAGERKSEFHRSGQIRGWGSWTAGFKTFTPELGEAVVVEHIASCRISDEERDRYLGRYAAALGQWDVKRNGDRLWLAEKDE